MDLMQIADRGPEQRHAFRDGRFLLLPTPIHEQQTMLAHFPAPTLAVRSALPTKQLRVAELFPGRTVVGIACMEYSVLDVLEPYREVGIMIPVRYRPLLNVPALPIVAPQSFPNTGYYFHRMPVTDRDAFSLGVDLHGLRKVLADIHFEEDRQHRRCTVRVDHELLLELEVRKARRRVPPTTLTTQTYTFRHGRLLRTPVPTHGSYGIRLGPRCARLTLGPHPMADELRALKLATAPLWALHGTGLESLLCAPAEELPL